MGRPRKDESSNKPQTSAPPAPPGSPPQKPAAAPASDEPKKEEARTLTVRFDEQGRVLPMTPDNLERFRRTAEQMPELSAETRARLAPPKIVDAKWAGRLYGAVARIQALTLRLLTGIPAKETLPALDFTPQEREELGEPTAELLNRYFGRILARHGAAIELTIRLGAMETEKAASAAAIVRKLQEGGEK